MSLPKRQCQARPSSSRLDPCAAGGGFPVKKRERRKNWSILILKEKDKKFKMGFGVEPSVDCSSDGSPIESYYSSWSENRNQKIFSESECLFASGTTG